MQRERGTGAVFLISGLTLSRVNSFAVQLALLARGLESLNTTCVAIGTRAKTPISRGVSTSTPRRRSGRTAVEFPRSCRVTELDELGVSQLGPLLTRHEPRALLLLGYPDQFPFLTTQEWSSEYVVTAPSIFLWAQFSRAPRRLPDDATIVPLTPTSAAYAEAAGTHAPADPIPHGVDLDTFVPLDKELRLSVRRSFGIPVESFLVGYVATNQIRKRHDRLLDAFLEIRARVPDAHLCIKTDRSATAGGFDLESMVRARDLEGAVTVVAGPTGEQRLAELVACFDTYLHVSEWEGFGIPAAEALACGVPLVTHAGQGPGELTPFPELVCESDTVFDDSGTRLRHIRTDSAAEAVALVACMDVSSRRRLADRARTHAENHFDYRTVARRWLGLVELWEA